MARQLVRADRGQVFIYKDGETKKVNSDLYDTDPDGKSELERYKALGWEEGTANTSNNNNNDDRSFTE